MSDLPARESMEFDVVVVGAGPAGLATAIRLKQQALEQGGHVRDDVLDIRWRRDFDDPGEALRQAAAGPGGIVFGELEADHAALIPGEAAEPDGGLEEREECLGIGRMFPHALL